VIAPMRAFALGLLVALAILSLFGCGSGDPEPAPVAMCWCTKPFASGTQTYQCACGSEEHRRYGR
jgi:hypothetical protein